MGAQLAKYFQEAQDIGGSVGRVRLAMLALISSTDANKLPDTAENIGKMQDAFKRLKTEINK